ncbi:unnamed protein product [Protopolystoma xenopodis]|uniref:CDT1 Geminin-binding domain-containing protein n=1 Tax=Protopolystoma xenopodis TaxID=117903 RepID=A0A3S5AME7_9PLAT|nr:unnamed protein product [Protopolystoma xenopodis]
MQDRAITDYFGVSKTPSAYHLRKRDISKLSPDTIKVQIEKPEGSISFGKRKVSALDNCIESKEEPLRTKQSIPNLDHFASSSPIKTLTFLPAHERFAHLSSNASTPALHTSPLKTPTKKFLSQHQEQYGVSLPRPGEENVTALTNLVEGAEATSIISPELHLPSHMRLLWELFRACDNVVSMLHNRSEMCRFDKVRLSVQEIVRRDFDERHVAQFITVYPDAYKLHYERQLDKHTRQATSEFVLVLTPNLRTG